MAVGLLNNGVNVDVFESAASFGEIGAGISFGLNAQNALRKLGLGEAFDRLATTIPSGQYFQWRKGEGQDQRVLSETRCKNGNSSVHRAKFLDEIVKHIPDEICHFGKRFERVEELQASSGLERRYRLFFADGSTYDTDVIVGCDGIHSNVRKFLRAEQEQANKDITTDADGDSKPLKDLIWSGTWAYRGLIPTEEFFARLGEEKGRLYGLTPQMFLGKDRHILTFPIDDGKVINVVAFKTDRSQWPKRALLKESEPWTQKSSQKELLADFPGWGPDLITLLKCIPQPPSKWALHTIDPPLQSYISQNNAIIVAGDAAHGGCPHHGAMAGQAIEDALFISRLLSYRGITRNNISTALGVIDAIRLPRANKTMQESLRLGDKYELASDEFGEDVDQLAQWLTTAWDWIWDHDHDLEWEKAVTWLEERGITTTADDDATLTKAVTKKRKTDEGSDAVPLKRKVKVVETKLIKC